MSAIETVDAKVEALRSDMQRLQSREGGLTQADLRMLQDRIGRIEQQLADQQAAKVRDQDALLAKVSEQVNISMREYLSGSPPPTRTPPSQASRSSHPPRSPSSSPTVERGWEHIVEAGQTLSAIAVAYGTTTQAILKANNLQNADSIRVNQKLFIPAPAQ